MELHCGLVNGQVGNSQGLNVTSVQKVLEACPELSPDWLILGTGTMERRSEPLSGSAAQKESEKPISQDKVAEPTNIYHLNLPPQGTEPLITIPESVLQTIKQQLEQKDNQIAKLLEIMNSQK
jgi:hypothetical protein